MSTMMAVSSDSHKKKKPRSPIDIGDQDVEFDNPLAGSDEAGDTRKDFQAGGGELPEYGEGFDDQFSSSQIFQKIETEASVSPQPQPLPLTSPPRANLVAPVLPTNIQARAVGGCAETPGKLRANVHANTSELRRQPVQSVASAVGHSSCGSDHVPVPNRSLRLGVSSRR